MSQYQNSLRHIFRRLQFCRIFYRVTNVDQTIVKLVRFNDICRTTKIARSIQTLVLNISLPLTHLTQCSINATFVESFSIEYLIDLVIASIFPLIKRKKKRSLSCVHFCRMNEIIFSIINQLICYCQLSHQWFNNASHVTCEHGAR